MDAPAAAARDRYGLWSAALTILIATALNTPAQLTAAMRRQGYPPGVIQAYTSAPTHPAATIGALVSALLCAVPAAGAYRGHRWAFWVGLVWFGFTGLGAFWVPLRPQSHVGEDGATLVVHAFANDLPGLWQRHGLLERADVRGRLGVHRALAAAAIVVYLLHVLTH